MSVGGEKIYLPTKSTMRRETKNGSGTVGQHLQSFKEEATCSYKLAIVCIFYELRRPLKTLRTQSNCSDIGIPGK